jgi:hypothetical protein
MGREPFAPDGAQIVALGASSVHLYDAQDRHTGPTPEGTVEIDIPRSTYTQAGQNIYASVPAGSIYSIVILPDGDQPFDLRIRDVQGQGARPIQHTYVYVDVRVGAGGYATVIYNPDRPADSSSMAIDDDGDGTPDRYVSPLGILDPEDSYDLEPPTTAIQVEGNQRAPGWYTGLVIVTLSAEDAQSGVAEIRYSLDGGRTVRTYSGPLQIWAEEVPVVSAYAIDRAGNRSQPVSARLQPYRMYLGLITNQW